MSWTDKIGTAFGWVKDSAVPTIGGALAGAQNWVDSTPGLSQIDDAINPVHALVTNPVSGPVVGQGAGLVGTAFSYGVARPISTFSQVTGQASADKSLSPAQTLGFLTDTDNWRKAWGASEDVSPGQALTIGSGLAPKGLNYDMTPDAMKAREEFFHNTWQGQISSGSMDLALNLGADPTMLAAKGVKGAALARNTFKDAAERDAVLKVNAGTATAASGRESALSGRMDKFFTQLDGKSSAEIALHPVVKESDQSGAFAYMFGRANEQFTDDAARREAQRNIFGSMLGNGDSIAALKEQHALLANDLQRLSDTPITSKAVADFTWGDHGQGMFAIANATEPAEVTAQKDAIEHELARLESITTPQLRTNRLAGTLREQHQYETQLQSVRQTTINSGLGNMPIRVIGGALSNRVPGHVSIKNPVQGFEDLRNTLAQAPHLDNATRQELLSKYTNAANEGERQSAVYAAEGAIVGSTAQKYGLSNQQARDLLTAGQGRYQAIRAQLSSRLYSAAESDKFVHFVNPEDGEVAAFSKPLLQTQIEDNVGLVDPRQLDKALKEASHNRLLERITGQTGLDASGIAPSAYEIAGSAQMIGDAALRGITRVWKDMALMRLAYPARVQIDSQMRLMTRMGIMAHMGATLGLEKTDVAAIGKSLVTANVKGAGRAAGTAFGKGTLAAQGKHLLSQQGSDGYSLKNLFKEGDYEKSLGAMFRGAGFSEAEIAQQIRMLDPESGLANLADTMANAKLAQFRATGDWGYVDPKNANWGMAWTRAVNQQIRNSPTAMKAMEGGTTDDMRRFIQTDPAARKEWLNLKSSNGDDMDAWIANVQAHVDHYVPTGDMRGTLLERDAKDSDVQSWFGNVDDRMHVHGESYAATTKNPAAAWYENFRNRYYKIAAEAPEMTMAKAPLFVHAFKRNLADAVAAYGDEPIDQAAMTSLRQSASRAARREVGKILYDTSHSSNLSQSMRYVSPFFGAWEDMVKKWGGLFYDKPWAAVRFEQAWNAPNNAGIVVDENGNRVDAMGNRYEVKKDASGRVISTRKLDPVKDKYLIGKRELVVLPARMLGGIAGATDLRIDKNSFNIVFQGDPWWLPGAGPLVQVPVNEMVKHGMIKNTDSPLVSTLLPYGVTDNSPLEQFMPGWARNARAAFMQNGQEYSNVRALLLAQETQRHQNGDRATAPTPDEIDNMTRNWFIMKAITSDASPVSISPSAKYQFYVDQAHIYKQKYNAEWSKANNGATWQEQFQKDFPDYYLMSLSLSDNSTGIVSTDNAVAASRQPAIRRIIRSNPEYGWAAVGADNMYDNTPGGAFSQSAYVQQEALGDRGQSTPEVALAKAQASQGWMQYQGMMTKLNQVLDARGLHSFQQKGAEDLAGLKKEAEDYLASHNDAWRQDFLSTDSGKVVNFLDWAQKSMANDSTLAKRPDMVAIGQYTQLRQAVQKILSGRTKRDLEDPSNVDVKSLWDAGTSYLRSNNIGFEQAWNRILQHDKPSQELLGLGG